MSLAKDGGARSTLMVGLGFAGAEHPANKARRATKSNVFISLPKPKGVQCTVE